MGTTDERYADEAGRSSSREIYWLRNTCRVPLEQMRSQKNRLCNNCSQRTKRHSGTRKSMLIGTVPAHMFIRVGQGCVTKHMRTAQGGEGKGFIGRESGVGHARDLSSRAKAGEDG